MTNVLLVNEFSSTSESYTQTAVLQNMEFNSASHWPSDIPEWTGVQLPGNFTEQDMSLYSKAELNRENIRLLNNNELMNERRGDLDSNNLVGDYFVPYSHQSGSSVSSPSLVAGVNAPAPESKTSPLTGPDEKKGPKGKKQLLAEQDAILLSKDDSELTEEELQMKRRAQNRAAQRAFRERKEIKLKELETRLAQSEEEKRILLNQLDSARRQNASMKTENESLKAGSGSGPNAAYESSKFVFPSTQTEFINALMKDTPHVLKENTLNKVYEDTQNPGKKLMVVGAVWDYLQSKSEDNSDIDIIKVMELLRGHEKCHGYGPAYPIELVDSTIQRCSSK